jgi:hypothetical protein
MITGKQLFNDNLITGKEFKILYPNMKFYLISTKNDNFKDGYNEDLDLLSSSHDIFFLSNKMRFTNLDNIAQFIKEDCYIREVQILDDSLIFSFVNEFITNKFILSEKILLKKFEYWNDYDFCKNAIEENHHAIHYVKEQKDLKELCELACKQYHHANSHYVKEQKDLKELCELACKQYLEKDLLIEIINNNKLFEDNFFKLKHKESILHINNIYDIVKKEIHNNSTIPNYYSLKKSNIIKLYKHKKEVFIIKEFYKNIMIEHSKQKIYLTIFYSILIVFLSLIYIFNFRTFSLKI